MRLSSTPEFLPGEIVLKESPATRYYQKGLKGGSSNGKLWLTNQRLIFKAGFGYQIAFPLYSINQAETRTYGLFNFTVLYLAFDDERKERFSTRQVETWSEAVLTAKVSALPLPQGLTKLAQQEKAGHQAALAVIGLVMGLVGLCAAPMFCLLSALFVVVRGA